MVVVVGGNVVVVVEEEVVEVVVAGMVVVDEGGGEVVVSVVSPEQAETSSPAASRVPHRARRAAVPTMWRIMPIPGWCSQLSQPNLHYLSTISCKKQLSNAKYCYQRA